MQINLMVVYFYNFITNYKKVLHAVSQDSRVGENCLYPGFGFGNYFF